MTEEETLLADLMRAKLLFQARDIARVMGAPLPTALTGTAEQLKAIRGRDGA